MQQFPLKPAKRPRTACTFSFAIFFSPLVCLRNNFEAKKMEYVPDEVVEEEQVSSFQFVYLAISYCLIYFAIGFQNLMTPSAR